MGDSSIEESLSSLSIKPTNQILWNHEKNIGIINCPKGNVWNTIGVFSSGKAYVYADEAFFLMDSHGFEIADESNSNYSSPKINSFDDILSIIAKDCGLSSYKLFKTLKKHGYILLRPECKYFSKPRLFEALRAEYSLFKPSSTFKKTNPSGLIGHIFEVKNNDKVGFIIEKIECISGTVILAISDEMNGFCFLSAAAICPNPSQIESSNIQLKQLKYQKSSVN